MSRSIYRPWPCPPALLAEHGTVPQPAIQHPVILMKNYRGNVFYQGGPPSHRVPINHLWVNDVAHPVPVQQAVSFFYRGHHLYDGAGNPVEPVNFRNQNTVALMPSRNADNIPPWNGGQGGPSGAPPASLLVGAFAGGPPPLPTAFAGANPPPTNAFAGTLPTPPAIFAGVNAPPATAFRGANQAPLNPWAPLPPQVNQAPHPLGQRVAPRSAATPSLAGSTSAPSAARPGTPASQQNLSNIWGFPDYADAPPEELDAGYAGSKYTL
jgi:hypothetical protein